MHSFLMIFFFTAAPRPGMCPAVPDGTVGTCVDQCQTDADCSETGHKCCSNGCGHACVPPGTIYFQYKMFLA